MAVTSPSILQLMNIRHEAFKPSLLLGRSQRMVDGGVGWGLAADQAGAEVGPSTRTAVDLGLAGAQGEPNPETGVAENLQDPTATKYIFVGNIACCPRCAEMSGMEVPAGVSIFEISHPNCRCQIVPASVAQGMLMNQLPNPQFNPTPGSSIKNPIPYSYAETQRAMNAQDYYRNAMERRRMSMMGLR
jgi:hypothetical protein